MRGMGKQQSDEFTSQRLQDFIASFLNSLINEDPMLSSVTHEDLILKSAAPLIFNHKLGRKPIGFLPILKDTDANIWFTKTNAPISTIQVNTSLDVTINLRVF